MEEITVSSTVELTMETTELASATAIETNNRAAPDTPSEEDKPSISSDVLRPVLPRRRPNLPPLPDLRFEQSYLASLNGADTWGRVAWITVRDQMLLPLIQGTLWTLALAGWRSWNRNASVSGATLGSRLRRWWYGVNNWELPPARNPRLAAQVEDVSSRLVEHFGRALCSLNCEWVFSLFFRLTDEEFLQYYKTQFSTAGDG